MGKTKFSNKTAHIANAMEVTTTGKSTFSWFTNIDRFALSVFTRQDPEENLTEVRGLTETQFLLLNTHFNIDILFTLSCSVA